MKNRSLEAIAADIRKSLKAEVADVIKVGELLAEARELLQYGEWYAWLREQFSLSQRSALRYVAAYEFVAGKSDIVSDLKLRVSALHVLAGDQSLRPKEIKAVLKEAKSRWVGGTRAKQIIKDIRGADEPSDEEPPPLPPDDDVKPPPTPPPAPLPRDAALAREFGDAIATLLRLMTKPSAKFVGAVAAADLELVANFLNQIAGKTKTADREEHASGVGGANSPATPPTKTDAGTVDAGGADLGIPDFLLRS